MLSNIHFADPSVDYMLNLKWNLTTKNMVVERPVKSSHHRFQTNKTFLFTVAVVVIVSINLGSKPT